MKKSLRSLALAGLLCMNLPATAQFFTPPVAHERVFPSASTGALLRPETSSAYSMSGVQSPSGPFGDLYLSGWSGQAGGGFAWQFTNINDPTTVIDSSYVLYPGCRDIEVGLVDGGPGRQILVAYHKAGSGHYLDVYDIVPGSGVNYSYTVPLSSYPNYTRISMDCHLTYGVAIVWENPFNGGIEAMAGNNGGWGPVVTLPVHPTGAASTDPDVAFSHVSSLDVHIVSVVQGAGEITESVISWPDLLSGSLGSYAVQDNNFVGGFSVKPVRPVIDCTDHYGVDNWAYTYTIDNNDISVRYVDFFSTGVPTTAVINSGILPAMWGITPTTWNYRNKMPSLAYGQNGDNMYIGWYVEDMTATGNNQYIALHVSQDVSTLISAPEYMGIPNATTGTPYPLTPGISLSKMNDLNPSFLYAAYYDHGAGYQMHNAYHHWPDPVFKGAENISAHQRYHPECGNQHKAATALTARADVKVSPNPFTNVINALVNTDQNGIARLQLTDITGRTVSQSQVSIEKGIQSVQTGELNNLAAGTYILNVFMDDIRIGQQKVVKQ